MPKTAQPPRRPASVSRSERAFLAEKERRRERHVSVRRDLELLRRHASDPYGMIHRMASKGLLLAIAPGSYLIAPATDAKRLQQAAPVQLALHARLFAYGEYFLSYFSALSEHGLTDLDDPVLYAAFRGGDLRNVTIGGQRVHLTRIKAERKWFGIEEVRVGEGRRAPHYNRATIERVLLDTLDRPRLCGSPEVIIRAWERAARQNRSDWKQLVADAPSMGHSVTRRAGFLLDQLGFSSRSKPLLKHLGNTSVPILLDASRHYGESDWTIDRKWAIVQNIPEHALVGWLAYGK